MKAKLKELLEKAEQKSQGKYNEFLLIPTNKEYNGFWGKNGFNNLIVLGRNTCDGDKEWYRISNEQCDVMNIIDNKHWCNIDVPSEYGCIHLFFDELFNLTPPASALMLYSENGLLFGGSK